MPEFILETFGTVDNTTGGRPIEWHDLGSFTQGYLEGFPK